MGIPFPPNGGPGQAPASELSEPAIPVVRLGKSERPPPRMLSNLLGLIKRDPPDILHSYLPSANIATGLVKRVDPDLPVVWGLRMTDGDGRRYHSMHRLMSWLEHRLLWRPDLMIANAPSVRRAAVAGGLPGDRIEVMPNGFDTDKFRPDPEERKRVRLAAPRTWPHVACSSNKNGAEGGDRTHTELALLRILSSRLSIIRIDVFPFSSSLSET